MVGVLPEEINIDWLEEWKAFFSPRTLERGLGSGFGKIRAAFLGWAGSQEMGAPLAPCWVWLVPLLRGTSRGMTLRDGDPTGIPWMLMPGATLSSLLQQRCCDTLTLLLTIVVWVYPVCLLQKKEGTFSLSFAQSFPFTVSKTTELDAKAGAVGTSAGEVSPACVSHQLLAFRIPWRSRCCTGAAAERGECERWESFGSKAEWD